MIQDATWALASAAKERVRAFGGEPLARGLKGIVRVRDSWREGLTEEQWRDRFAACFDIEEKPSFERYLQSAFKEMGGLGRAQSAMDLLDCAQAQLLALGAWEPALGLERLREEAEQKAGRALSGHGLKRGSVQALPAPGWSAEAAAQTPFRAWLGCFFKHAQRESSEEDAARREEEWVVLGGSKKERAAERMSLDQLALGQARALELLAMDGAGETGRSEQAMELVRRCHEWALETQSWREDDNVAPCQMAASLAACAGRACVRLLKAGGDGAWLFDAYGVIWDGECALRIEGQGMEDPLPEFWAGMEQESMAVGPVAQGARSKARAL